MFVTILTATILTSATQFERFRVECTLGYLLNERAMLREIADAELYRNPRLDALLKIGMRGPKLVKQGGPDLVEPESKRRKLEKDIAATLQVVDDPNHPKVQELRRKLAEVEEEIPARQVPPFVEEFRRIGQEAESLGRNVADLFMRR